MPILSHEEFAKDYILQKEDVWGNPSDGSRGMIIARSGDKCPIFHDEIPFKSVTVICNSDQYIEVSYWLAYVHGGNCISKEKALDNGRIALRSDYQCW